MIVADSTAAPGTVTRWLLLQVGGSDLGGGSPIREVRRRSGWWMVGMFKIQRILSKTPDDAGENNRLAAQTLIVYHPCPQKWHH